MANLKAYLAEKYMSGPKADAILAKTVQNKKKKRKGQITSTPSGGGAVIRDEDGGWGDERKNDVDGDDTSEAVVASDRGFKKRRIAPSEDESSWITVREGLDGSTPVKEESPPPQADEQPMVVDTFSGGLVHAKDLKNMPPQNQTLKTSDYTAEDIAKAQETVYRDASGKKIDTKAARAEAARLKREREEKEAQKMEWGKGLVQRDEKEKQRLQMEKNKSKGFARYVDDKDLNEELKAKEVWNDPAAAFLTKRKSKGPRKPEYSGPPPPPNRFGIKPGYRWDGVDRGTGFEKKLFQAQNSRKRHGTESYQWSVDDM